MIWDLGGGVSCFFGTKNYGLLQFLLVIRHDPFWQMFCFEGAPSVDIKRILGWCHCTSDDLTTARLEGSESRQMKPFQPLLRLLGSCYCPDPR